MFPNPILPLVTESEESLDALAAAAAEAGASFFGGDLLFLKPAAREVFFPFLKRHFPEALPRYQELFGNAAFLRGDYVNEVRQRVGRLRARHGLASAPAEYAPELWDGDPQGNLFAGSISAAMDVRRQCSA